MLHDILGHDHIQWHPPLIRHFTKSWPCYRTGPYHRVWRYYLIPGDFHWTFATDAASQQRTHRYGSICHVLQMELVCANVKYVYFGKKINKIWTCSTTLFMLIINRDCLSGTLYFISISCADRHFLHNSLSNQWQQIDFLLLYARFL